MRRPILVAAAAAGIVTTIAVVALTSRDPAPDPTDSSSPAAAAASTSSPRSTSAGYAAFTAPGSYIYAGVPAVVSLTDGSGSQVVVELTVQGLEILPAEDAAALLEQTPSLPAGAATVYQMPVRLTVLSAEASLSAAVLSSVTVATHPGEDPLPSVNTLTVGSCLGLPEALRLFVAGQSLQWYVHAAAVPGASTPIGGQFHTTTGAYVSGVIWAAKGFQSDVEIPR
ncbi:MAG: hypothetical protein QM598_05880 [Protaetiibacter sp.]